MKKILQSISVQVWLGRKQWNLATISKCSFLLSYRYNDIVDETTHV